MQREHHAQGDAEVREERAAVERRVRETLSEIRSAIDHLERTCRQGRITPFELIEEREMLRVQEQALRVRGD
jgi:hypothetical protein